ncbi:MAG TPA: SDR family oxidoreductase [Desulfobulbaceae bacterium]|nr:SDR family oxidoreductase [Desulfobulbaceae bacterium]
MCTDNLFSLRGRNVLITGASGFLGRYMVSAVAQAGAHVLVNARTLEKAKPVVEDLHEQGFSAEPLVFDVVNEKQVYSAINDLNGRPIHALVNNAYSGGAGSIANVQSKQYTDSCQISIAAVHLLFTAFLPSLQLAVKDVGHASVINIASMYGMVSPDLRVYDHSDSANPPFYGVAKAALIQWSRYAACEFGALGIRVNSLSPGPFPNYKVQKDQSAFVQRLADRVPMGRIGSPEEIGGPVVFLASSASTYVNGANLVVDGGWTAW